MSSMDELPSEISSRWENPKDGVARRLFEPVAEMDQRLPSADDLAEIFPDWEAIDVAIRTESLMIQRLRRRDDGQLGRLVFANGALVGDLWQKGEMGNALICGVLESASEEDFHYHIFEDFAGETLADAMDMGRVSREQLIEVIHPQIKEALEYAKERGLPMDTRLTSIGYSKDGKLKLVPFGDDRHKKRQHLAEDLDLAVGRQLVGSQIGPFRLIEMIGEGGFAEVYRAKQSSPVKRQVALKILKTGMDSEDIIARFGAERQALAAMDHPNIAQIYDGGMTASGRPYFVMELVDGRPLSGFCQDNVLTISQKLCLFVDVCKAVHHAHFQGVIHRDLKPSNILVVDIPSKDGVHPVKVIDFGIAKAVGGRELTDKTLHTKFYQFLGSLGYISPEQITARGDVDARSDVYALGCVLYEMMSGTTPLKAAWIADTTHYEVAEAIVKTEFDPPSVRNPLARVPQDLDAVTMMALEKEPERRYQSAEALGEDVQRFLRQEPVLARVPSVLGKLWKLSCRHRVAAVMTGITLMSLIIATGISVWGWFTTSLAAKRAKAAEQVAERQLYKAQIGQSQGALADGEMRTFWENMDHYEAPENESLRGWEWGWLRAQADTAYRVVAAHEGGVETLALNPQGNLLASGGRDGEVAIWDRVSGDCQVRFVSHVGPVMSVSWSADGRYLVSGGEDHSVAVWDVADRRLKARLSRHASPVVEVAWHPSRASFASAGSLGSVALWDWSENGAQLSGEVTVPEMVHSITWTHGGERLAIGHGSVNMSIFQWDLKSGKVTEEACILYHKCETKLAWNEALGVMAMSYSNQRISLWRVEQAEHYPGTPYYKEFGHLRTIRQLAWKPDGSPQLVSAGNDWLVKLWNLETRAAPIILRGHRGHVMAVTWAPDGKSIISGGRDGELRFWDTTLKVEKMYWALPPGGRYSGGGVIDVDWAPDGERIAISFAFSDGISIRNHGEVASGSLWGENGSQAVLAWHPDQPDQIAQASGSGRLSLRSTKDGSFLFQQNAIRANAILWNPQGTHVALLSYYSLMLDVWDMEGQAKLSRVEVHPRDDRENVFNGVAWHPNGRHVAFAEESGFVSVWDVMKERATLLWELKVSDSSAYAVAWRSDGEVLAVGGEDGGLHFVEASSRRVIKSMRAHDEAIMDLAWSPDDRRLVTGSVDRRIRFIDPRDMDVRMTFHLGNELAITRISWNREGTRLLALSEDGRLGVLDSAALPERLARDPAVEKVDGVGERRMELTVAPALWSGMSSVGERDCRSLVKGVDKRSDPGGWYWQATKGLARLELGEFQGIRDVADAAAGLRSAQAHAEWLQLIQRSHEILEKHPIADLTLSDSSGYFKMRTPESSAALDEDERLLSSFPRGNQWFGGIPFAIEDMLRMGSLVAQSNGYDYPVVSRLKGPGKGHRLHFLHTSRYTPSEENPETKLAEYILHYADGTEHSIPVIHGENIADHYITKTEILPDKLSGATAAWVRKHPRLVERPKGFVLAFFLMTAENPHPEKEIDQIVVRSTMANPALILAGVTVER
ncbi:MAG: WD40 repeat protein/serine/threonine protein kinase [Verrucomicrobiales bacterium]|jgi:WD40 repeat protein/serine/threonine protein kinase